MKLKNKVAIITGGGTGIGRAIAHTFADEGASVVVASRTLSNLQMVVNEIEAKGGNIKAIQTDVSDEVQVQRMVTETIKNYGQIDILVNNSASTQKVDVNVVDMKLADWNAVISVNLTGTMLCCREVLKFMIPRRSGNIINVSSVGGISGHPTLSAYCASKWGIIGFTETLAIEVGLHNIRVNCISPAATRTDMFFKFISATCENLGMPFDELLEKISRGYSLKRIAEPSEVAAAALFLASQDSSAITGHNLVVSCGFHMLQPNEIVDLYLK